MHIAFIGFGEAARAFCDSLRAHDGALEFSAYDILLDRENRDGACAQAMRERSVHLCTAPREAAAQGDWIISAVTADQSLAAAEAVSPHVKSGQLFFDINSVSPERKRQTAALVERNGALYVDMAVMAPVHPRGHRTPVLVAGAMSEAHRERLRDLEFDFDFVGEEVGAATSVKMVRSLFVKGLEAISVEVVLAAAASGCLDRVLSSLSRSYPGLNMSQLALYNMERMRKHGARRAAEMRESAATLDQLGLAGDLGRAIAALHELMGALPEDRAALGDLDEAARRLLALRLAEHRKDQDPSLEPLG